MNVVLLAEESAGLRALRAIHKRVERLVAVLTSPEDRNNSVGSVAETAQTLGYQVLHPESATHASFASRLRDLEVDLILNVHSLHILHPEVVAAPRIGSFNLHPGPLPEMAGLNVPSWAIYLQKKEHAVTLHWMAAGIDAGPIAYVEKFELGDNDTGLSVSNKCVVLGLPLIIRLLEAAATARDSIPAEPQDSGTRRLFKRGDVPNEGRLNWTESARQITAFVRAADFGPLASPWGCPQTALGNTPLGVCRAHLTGKPANATPGTILSVAGTSVLIAAGDEVVAIEKVSVNDRTYNANEVLSPGQCLS